MGLGLACRRPITTVAAAVVTAALIFSACGSDDDSGGSAATGSDGAEKTKVAALFTQSVSQGNWDRPGHEAFEKMAAKYGYEPTTVEQASYEKAPAILRDLATQGNKLIILHSSGYAAAVERVAPEFPETEFVVFSYATDTKGLDNYSAWSFDFDEYGFVAGAVAGIASEAGNISIIAAEPIPSTERVIEYMIKGAKHVNPSVKTSSAYVGSFDDAAKANEIATQALGNGADFFLPLADMADVGIYQAAEQGGAKTMSEYVDQHEEYPEAIISATLLDFERGYDDVGKVFSEGELDGQIVEMGYANDMMGLAPFRNVDSKVQEQVDELIGQIKSGELDVADL